MRRDYDLNRRRPPLAPIVATIAALTLSAVAVALWVLHLGGLHL